MTNGYVGYGNADRWDSTYSSHDSYPTWLGKSIWKIVHEYLDRDNNLENFKKDLLECGEWDQMEECTDCGKRGLGLALTDPETGEHYHEEVVSRDEIGNATYDPQNNLWPEIGCDWWYLVSGDDFTLSIGHPDDVFTPEYVIDLRGKEPNWDKVWAGEKDIYDEEDGARL